ncbi:hypothetical protein BKA64DRAFT_722703, partial [Cadophora sp. MPI-SDFR-AT-0126]
MLAPATPTSVCFYPDLFYNLASSENPAKIMSSPPPFKTLTVLGPPLSGKTTMIGCLVSKLNGLDLHTMARFQAEGINTTAQAVKALKAQGERMEFETRCGKLMFLDNDTTTKADCAILVLAVDQELSDADFEEYTAAAKTAASDVVVLVNKMDICDWSEARFRAVVERLGEVKNISVLPFSALEGSDVVELSSRCRCEGWQSKGRIGTTLLETLEASFKTRLR